MILEFTIDGYLIRKFKNYIVRRISYDLSKLELRTTMGFGVMAALRIYPDRYNIAQRHIHLTNKAQL